MFVDFTNVEVKTVKGVARETAVSELFAMLTEKFGESNVTQTDSGTFAVALGEKDGAEVCIEFGVTGKDFVDRQTPKKGLVKAFNREDAGKAYKAKVAEAEEKKAANAEKKAAKAAKDKAAREAAKAKKAAEAAGEGSEG